MKKYTVALVALISSATEVQALELSQSSSVLLREEDDIDGEITNDHLEGHDMDSGDILAYSGEISGELAEQEAKEKKDGKNKIVKKSHKKKNSADKKSKKSSEKKNDKKPHEIQLIGNEQKS